MNTEISNCPHRRQKVAKVNAVTIHACALHKLCSLDIDANHGETRACKVCPNVGAKLLPKVDVVVTSHNYGNYLDDALDSVAIQSPRVLGSVIVVDDASGPDDQTRAVCERRGVKYLRTEFKSPHLARGAGFALCENRLVHFLDADNKLMDGYLQSAAELFEANQRLAIVYPDLQDFGTHDKLRRMQDFDRAALERRNFIDTGAVWLREALEQVNAFGSDPAELEDWHTARSIMRSGRWEAVKNSIPLLYRRHGSQRSVEFRKLPYFELAALDAETITVFTTYSGRIQKSPELWERRKAWLREQTWPSIRLVVANTSHERLPDGWMDGLPPMAGLSVYDHPVGSPGLEDVDRRNQRVESGVSTAVAAIYQRMWQETQSEFVLILEDDVFPKRLDAIEQLLRGFDERTCAVTGRYTQRYFPYIVTVWKTTGHNGRPAARLHGPTEGIEDAQGSGFGCLMVRRSQMAHEPIQANTALGPYFDVNVFKALADQGRKIRINWGVDCDHVGEHHPPANFDPQTKLTIVVTTINRPSLIPTLNTINRQMTPGDEIWLVSDGKASPDLRETWYRLNQTGKLIELEDGPHGDWGHTPRNQVLPTIESGYVVNIDDDDTLADGALEAIRKAIRATPGDLLMLAMKRPDGSIIPEGHDLRRGNVGTPMLVYPAGVALGKFCPVYGGDFDFINETVSANPDRKLHWLNQTVVNIRPQTEQTLPIEHAEPVGDMVHEILAECGIHRPVCGECAAWRARMNAWGVQGCADHRAEILARLNVEASKSSWLEAAGVAARGYLSTAAILDEAIRRAGRQTAAA